MKILVDELPKSCGECVFCGVGFVSREWGGYHTDSACKLLDAPVKDEYRHLKPENCPLALGVKC